MNDATHHINRRRRAIDRLRSVTTGAAVAGIAGTVGFGALAAATWSGEPGATSAAAVTNGARNASRSSGSGSRVTGGSSNADNGSDDGDDGGSFFGTQPGGAFGTVPNSGNQNPAFIRPAQPGSRSHATSGGSH